MPQYFVYQHTDRTSQAVKDGFSWFGFFFPLPYLLVQSLWLHALVFLLIQVFIMLPGSPGTFWPDLWFDLDGRELVGILVNFFLRFVVAWGATEWIRERLRRSGYEYLERGEAPTSREAKAALAATPANSEGRL